MLCEFSFCETAMNILFYYTLKIQVLKKILIHKIFTKICQYTKIFQFMKIQLIRMLNTDTWNIIKIQLWYACVLYFHLVYWSLRNFAIRSPSRARWATFCVRLSKVDLSVLSIGRSSVSRIFTNSESSLSYCVRAKPLNTL